MKPIMLLQRAVTKTFVALAIFSLPIWLSLSFIPSEPSPRAQPLLLQMAAQQPESVISVIVQKSVADDRVERMVQAQGGIVTKDLAIINAFAAEIKGKETLPLSLEAGVRWVSLDAPTQSAGATPSRKFTTWATQIGTVAANGFTDPNNMLSAGGRDGSYGFGAKVKGAFGGFIAEYNPGYVISRVEVVLSLYVPKRLAASETPKLSVYVAGKAGPALVVPVYAIQPYGSAAAAGTVYFDVTHTRTWKWSDFSASRNLQVLIDQSAVAQNHPIYYDAVGLRVTAVKGADPTSPLTTSASSTYHGVNTRKLSSTFPQTTRATNVWNQAPEYYQGQGIAVAVIDSGLFGNQDLGSRVLGEVNFNSAAHSSNDGYGHGTFIAGVLADGGSLSGGKYVGIAPQVNVINVRVSDDVGMAYESDVVSGMQWVLNNANAYNIRVVNLSLNSAVWSSYNTDPLDAAAEILWFNKIVVVVSAGNKGSAALYPPANDPFVITVGATNDKGTARLGDDVLASFSAYGTDETGHVKPDLVAPGSNIIAYLPCKSNLTISALHPANCVDSNYFFMSGTSVAAPMVSGAAAMLVQSSPNLTPDQVKYRLMATANPNWPGYNPTTAGAGYLDVYAAVNGATTQSANTGLPASRVLWAGGQPTTWDSVNWNSVNWNSVNWNSVNWNSVNWNSVNWNSDYWGK